MIKVWLVLRFADNQRGLFINCPPHTWRIVLHQQWIYFLVTNCIWTFTSKTRHRCGSQSASPEKVSEMQVLGPPSSLLNQKLGEWGSVICASTSPAGDSDIQSSLRTTVRWGFELLHAVPVSLLLLWCSLFFLLTCSSYNISWLGN